MKDRQRKQQTKLKRQNIEEHVRAIVFIYVSLLVFFYTVIFDGKTYMPADTIASHSWETLINDAKTEGIYPLWNKYIFCGMPTLGSATIDPVMNWYDDIPLWTWGRIKLGMTYLFFRANEADYFVLYLLYGIGMYLFAFSKIKNKMIALVVALAGICSARTILLVMIGHYTKLAVMAWIPFLFLVLDKIWQDKLQGKRNWIFLTLTLALIIRLMTAPMHLQFVYYAYMALGIYFIVFFIQAFRNKEKEKIKSLSAGMASLAIATILAMAMGATQWLSVKEYQEYSIRGSNKIERTE